MQLCKTYKSQEGPKGPYFSPRYIFRDTFAQVQKRDIQMWATASITKRQNYKPFQYWSIEK